MPTPNELLDSLHPNHPLTETLKAAEELGFTVDQKRRKGELYVSYLGKPGYVINLRRKDTGHGILAYMRRTFHQVEAERSPKVEEVSSQEEESAVKVYMGNSLQGQIVKVMQQIKSGTADAVHAMMPPEFTRKRIIDSLYHIKYAGVVKQVGSVFHYIEKSARVEETDATPRTPKPVTTGEAEAPKVMTAAEVSAGTEGPALTPREKVVAFLKEYPKTNMNILVGTLVDVSRNQLRGILDTLKSEKAILFDGYLVTVVNRPLLEATPATAPAPEPAPAPEVVDRQALKEAEAKRHAEAQVTEAPMTLAEIVEKMGKSVQLVSDSLQIAVMGLGDVQKLLFKVPEVAAKEAEGADEIASVMELLSEIVSKRAKK